MVADRSVNAEKPRTKRCGAFPEKLFGGVLLSHPVPRAVPSALKGLASGFGMGPGVSPSLWQPKLYGVGPGTRPSLGNRTVDANTSRYFSPKREKVASPRPISTGQLHPLQGFHIRPINPVVYWEP